MSGLAQDPATGALHSWGMLQAQQPRIDRSEATQVQQPVVIGLHLETETQMIAEMLKKLPMPELRHAVGRVVNPSDFSSHVLARVPPQPPQCGICPPPGLAHCNAHMWHATPHPYQKVGADPFGMKDIFDVSKTADLEQCSTNDGGEHDSCESLPSEDEVAHAQVFHSPTRARGMTTLMVRNVPVMYTQQLLLREWKNEGTYDFLYLPLSTVEQKNMSFAFINFVSEAHAMAFKEKWHKQRMARFTARKPLNISFADVQGLRANILQVTRKRVATTEAPRNQPYIVVNGKSVEPAQALAVIGY